jgi:hypothetical protein
MMAVEVKFIFLIGNQMSDEIGEIKKGTLLLFSLRKLVQSKVQYSGLDCM